MYPKDKLVPLFTSQHSMNIIYCETHTYDIVPDMSTAKIYMHKTN